LISGIWTVESMYLFFDVKDDKQTEKKIGPSVQGTTAD
jgi:hypothetical protein